MAPFADVPRKTAGGVGELADKDCGGTGTMPKACSVGSDETGSWTGIALDAPEADEVGTGIDVSEAGVNGEGVIGAEAGPPVVEAVAADCVLIVEVAVARAGGTYCEMVELSGTE
jgi:hypothetical protein